MMLLLITVFLTHLFASKTDQCASFKIGKRRLLQDEKIAEFGLKEGIKTIHHCQEMLQIRQLTISLQFFGPMSHFSDSSTTLIRRVQ